MSESPSWSQKNHAVLFSVVIRIALGNEVSSTPKLISSLERVTDSLFFLEELMILRVSPLQSNKNNLKLVIAEAVRINLLSCTFFHSSTAIKVRRLLFTTRSKSTLAKRWTRSSLIANSWSGSNQAVSLSQFLLTPRCDHFSVPVCITFRLHASSTCITRSFWVNSFTHPRL